MMGSKRKGFDVVSVKTIEFKDTFDACVRKEMMHKQLACKQEL